MGSTATVEVQATLHASAEDIWGLLTDEGRIPMWSRSSAKVGDSLLDLQDLTHGICADGLESRLTV